MKSKLEELNGLGKITPYLYQQALSRVEHLPPNMQEQLVKESIEMSNAGVDSDEAQKEFFYVLMHAKSIANELSGGKLKPEDLAKVAHIIYSNRSKFPINTVLNFYRATQHALNKLQIPMKKIAYPQGELISHIESPRNVQKWMSAMSEIYAQAHRGIEFNKAFLIVTADWDIMEKKDFKHWMAFYEENAHKKYKTAAGYYEAGPGAMIPMDHLRAKLPGGPDMGQFAPAAVDDHAAQQQQQQAAIKKEDIRKKIKAIISRLNSAERLATEPDIQKELQRCLDIGVPKWLEELQRVKRMIQLAPMKSANSPILEDLIYKHANILEYNGFPKAATMMRKLAQMPPEMEAAPAQPGEMAPPDKGDAAIRELIEGMNHDEGDKQDAHAAEDELDSTASIVVTAQAPPEPADLEVTEDEAMPEPPEQAQELPSANPAPGNDMFDAALANVKVSDVIAKLETLANIFRTREISRQLSMIDLMMNKLGIASYFPSLAEANSKTLESNQYALTRIEDIISKLRGSVETPVADKVDLTGPGEDVKPIPEGNPDAVRSNLADEAAADKARKAQRKKEQDAAATPQPPQAQPPELAQPAAVESAPPVRVGPTG